MAQDKSYAGFRRPITPTIIVDTSPSGTDSEVECSVLNPPVAEVTTSTLLSGKLVDMSASTRRSNNGDNLLSVPGAHSRGSPVADEAYDEDELVLIPDPGIEADFHIEDNKFAFSPGQINKLFNPKSLAAFHTLGGLDVLEKGLRTDMKAGLSVDEQYLDGTMTFDESIMPYPQPTIPKVLDKTRGERIFEIPGRLGETSRGNVKCLGDTGAKYNFIAKTFARKLRYAFQHEDGREIMVSKTKSIRTLGIIQATFSFKNDSELHQLEFHVLPECDHNVILGKTFLKATKTFSDVRNQTKRVVERFVRTIRKASPLKIFFLGDSAPRFTGLLNGRPCEVLGDTGAQGLFISKSFARAKSFTINDDPYQRVTAKFADGSTARSVGVVHNVRWEYGLGGDGKAHILDFYVFDDLPADVILSDDFLYDTKAFANYNHYLLDEDVDEEDEEYLFAIKLIRNRAQQNVNSLAAQPGWQRVQDAHRRALEEQQQEDLLRGEVNASLSQVGQGLIPSPTLVPTPLSTPTLGAPATDPDTSSSSLSATSASADPSVSSSNHPPIPTTGLPPRQKLWRAKLAEKLKRKVPAKTPQQTTT